MQIAMTLNLDDFSASNGWLESWQRRHNHLKELMAYSRRKGCSELQELLEKAEHLVEAQAIKDNNSKKQITLLEMFK